MVNSHPLCRLSYRGILVAGKRFHEQARSASIPDRIHILTQAAAVVNPESAGMWLRGSFLQGTSLGDPLSRTSGSAWNPGQCNTLSCAAPGSPCVSPRSAARQAESWERRTWGEALLQRGFSPHCLFHTKVSPPSFSMGRDPSANRGEFLDFPFRGNPQLQEIPE